MSVGWFEVARDGVGNVIMSRIDKQSGLPAERTTMPAATARWLADELWRAAYASEPEPCPTSAKASDE